MEERRHESQIDVITVTGSEARPGHPAARVRGLRDASEPGDRS
jgi:hypothetical protein